MKIAYAGKKDITTLKPSNDTIVVTLSDTATEPTLAEKTNWFKHITYPFKVIATVRSFEECDIQAGNLAEYLREHIDGTKNVIIQCSYGEIRSPAVASGLASVFTRHEMFCIKSGKWTPHVSGSNVSNTFTARTQGFIRRGFREDHWLKKKLAETPVKDRNYVSAWIEPKKEKENA